MAWLKLRRMFEKIREHISENLRRSRGFSPAREVSQILPMQGWAKVWPFADAGAKAAPSQLFQDPECGSGRELNRSLPNDRVATVASQNRDPRNLMN